MKTIVDRQAAYIAKISVAFNIYTNPFIVLSNIKSTYRLSSLVSAERIVAEIPCSDSLDGIRC
ncbi:MAG: hypothetical protein EX341_05855 [Candidatus Scalindua sp. SCAELEC01]|nr:MAG: hypothetical protein EX341_05855 [Candidatus Scalindua sp. SCAELEC01]